MGHNKEESLIPTRKATTADMLSSCLDPLHIKRYFKDLRALMVRISFECIEEDFLCLSERYRILQNLTQEVNEEDTYTNSTNFLFNYKTVMQ